MALGASGCLFEDDKPDIDPTGTVQSTLTYGGGNCQKSGSEPFVVSIGEDAFGYQLTQSKPDVSISGFVNCGPEYCRINVNQHGSGIGAPTLDIELTVDRARTVTGTGSCSVFGSGTNCDQTVTVSGNLSGPL